MSQSVARALQVLIRLGDGPGTLDELAEQLGVHKTTVLRLVRTLADERFVHRDSGHRYRLGSRTFELANAALAEREVRVVAAPHLARLNRATGQTVHLGVREGDDVLYLDKYESSQPIRMYSRIGRPMPLHCTAVAKVLLADLTPQQRRQVAGSIEYTPYTGNTITSPDALLDELSRVADRGWAMDDAEHENHMLCIAAPVRDAAGRAVAAVSLSAPDVVLDRDHLLALLPELLQTARAASADCGHPGP